MAYLYKVTISYNQGGVIKELPKEIKIPFLPVHLNKKYSCHSWLFIDASWIKTSTNFSNTYGKISNTINSNSIPLAKASPGFNQLIAQNIEIHSLKTNF